MLVDERNCHIRIVAPSGKGGVCYLRLIVSSVDNDAGTERNLAGQSPTERSSALLTLPLFHPLPPFLALNESHRCSIPAFLYKTPDPRRFAPKILCLTTILRRATAPQQPIAPTVLTKWARELNPLVFVSSNIVSVRQLPLQTASGHSEISGSRTECTKGHPISLSNPHPRPRSLQRRPGLVSEAGSSLEALRTTVRRRRTARYHATGFLLRVGFRLGR